ncbi:MAG: membrane protein insertase YidC [Dysgonamonadaceae bacterium]|jgi:YidC/Oxa1 family membrane protein insertase|nr:membrane protein insertase YidC [Dysgonamonadaceae bacterium]
MDKNTVIGLVLIAAVVIGFSIYTRPSAEQIAQQKRVRDSLAQVEALRAQQQAEQPDKTVGDSLTASNEVVEQGPSAADFFGTSADSVAVQQTPVAAEKLITLENDKLRLKLNTKGGGVYSVQLKDYLRYTKDSLYLFEGNEAHFNLELYNRKSVRLMSGDQFFTPIVSADGKSVIMRLGDDTAKCIDFVYSLPDEGYMMNFDIRVAGMKQDLHPESQTNFKVRWEQRIRQQEKGRAFENRYARIHYKYDKQDAKKMSETKNDNKELSEPLKWFAFKDQFFTSVIIAEKPFSNTIFDSKVLDGDAEYIKDYRADVWVPVTVAPSGNELNIKLDYYFGPAHYNTLKAYGKQEKYKNLDLQELVDLGYPWVSWINKYFVIPIFNVFQRFGWSIGIIILLLTLLVKIILSPLTYKSYMSSAKMRVLRPQVKELEAKYPGQEKAMERQRAIMDLYSKAGASPMSGCMPMLLQMPVLLALFWFFPSAIELRQQSFLWADDLSTYDALIKWGGNIPFLSKYLGNHISIFCVLMTVVNVIYTKYNMASTDTGQQQMAGMKYMPYFMSVFMFFFLNSYPSGLNYYYFLSTFFTVAISTAFKYFVNEDKLLAQLEANKKKPKKKSGFMARLEEAQKLQEQQARQRAKENAKKRR